MNYLVLGASGFIGSQLCALDNNLFIEIDNFFAQGSRLPDSYCENAQLLYFLSRNENRFNIDGNIFQDLDRLLSFMKVNSLSKLTYASTSKVYGANLSGNIYENSINLDSDYAIYHFKRETYLNNFCRNLQIEFHIIRLFNIYGSFHNKSLERSTLVPNDFILQASKNNHIYLKSNGKKILNLVSILELKEFLICKLKGSQTFISTLYSNWYPTVLEVAELVQESFLRCLSMRINVETNQNDPSKYSSFRFVGQNPPVAHTAIESKMIFIEEIDRLVKRTMEGI